MLFNMLTIIIKGLIWIVLKFVALVYLPVYVFRCLQKSKFCPPIDDDLLKIPAVDLVKKIANNEISSSRAVRAYIARIKDVNPVINAVVEDRFEAAIDEAKEVDNYIANTKDTPEELLEKRPLLGVPITVKQSVAVAGMSHHCGCLLVKDKKAEKDAKVVELCRSAGAIPLLISNTPEYCLCWESFNKITGTTYNPYDTRRTCGGSSGGEAALLGAAASLISIGSDIAGSLRIPAHFCGVFGHKPTMRVVPVSGHRPNCADQEVWTRNFVIGPMTRYACDMPLLLRILSDDLHTNRLKLNESIDIKNVQIYYMEDDAGNILSHTVDHEIIEGMRRVISYFQKQHGIVAKKVNLKTFCSSPSLAFVTMLDVQGVDSVFKDGNAYVCWEMLKMLIGCSSVTLPAVIYETFSRTLHQITPRRYIENLWKKNDQFRAKIEALLGDNGVFLYPCFPSAAMFHKQVYPKAFDTSYAAIFNTLGLPATSCPMGFTSRGLPMGLQIVGKLNCDRVCIGVAQEIERAYRGWQPPPTNGSII